MNDPEPRVSEIGQELGLSDETIELARGYATRAWYEYPVNRKAESVAAGALYIAALVNNEKRTQPTICEIADCSEASLRSTYHEMWKYEMPDSYEAVHDSGEDAVDTGRLWSITIPPKLKRIGMTALNVGIVLVAVTAFAVFILPNMGMSEQVDPADFEYVGAPAFEFVLVWIGLLVLTLLVLPYLPGRVGGTFR